MEIGEYYKPNQKKLQSVTDKDWLVALDKCEEYCFLRVGQKKLFGAHSFAKLGEDAEKYYTRLAAELLICGRWEWKEPYTLSEQLIRVAGSKISAEVKKTKTEKAKKEKIIYDDMESFFYGGLEDDSEILLQEVKNVSALVECLENSIKGDIDLEYFWECIKDTMKREQIAAMMERTVKQLDKLRERFINVVRKQCLNLSR